MSSGSQRNEEQVDFGLRVPYCTLLSGLCGPTTVSSGFCNVKAVLFCQHALLEACTCKPRPQGYPDIHAALLRVLGVILV